MNRLNLDFNVPFYIFDEVVEYVKLKANGNDKVMKKENIKALLRLAVVNNRLTKEQLEYIQNMLE